MNRMCWWLLLSSLFFTAFVQAKPLAPDKVPESLKPWISWVMQDYPERGCPFLYNSFEEKRCEWATELNVNLEANKGSFTGSWQVYKDDDWVYLLGDDKHWPLAVTVNGKTALVMDKDGRPAIKLSTGIYEIKGEFLWESIPDNLTLPDDAGLISLQMNGQTIHAPTIREGQLWLKDSERGQVKPENVQNSVDVQVFRKIIDDVPLQVLTHLDIEVSGVQREEKITGALLADFIPLQLQSPLPARLDDGQLVVQLKPGRWQIDIMARSDKDREQLVLPPKETLPEDSDKSEIWVFDARPELRVVEIASLSTIDASQTTLPNDWRNLPAYKMNPTDTMSFKVIRRGDPDPEPNKLTLNRKLWLDFDGAGYTINDHITGKMTKGWRLNALPETQLGRLTLDGNSQLITQQTGTDKKGVEVRGGALTLDADSRIDGNIAHINAVGWEQTFHHVNAELNLPPGWRLLAATGVDNVPDSWISRWTLMDLFVVLITSLIIGHLWNRYWGGLALVTLAIIWHEADAPQFIWLHILAATALLSVLPQGKFFKFAHWYRRGSWLALVFITLPFMVDQVRIGIYPQLERPWQDIYPDSNVVGGSGYMNAMPASAPVVMQAELANPSPSPPVAADSIEPEADYAAVESKNQVSEMKAPSLRKLSKPKEALQQQDNAYNQSYASKKSVDFARVDPKANIQTGPGLPQWQWHKVYLSWNGSVNAEQQLSLWYLSPMLTMLLNFLRVILVALLSVLLFGSAEKILPPFINKWSFGGKATPLLLCLLILPLLCTPTQKVYADELPDDALLKQLQEKLQQEVVPDCLPACAHIQQMKMLINDKEVQITLQIHAQESVVLPLPAEYEQWFPNQVLDNGKASQALYRTDNALWINLKQGEHEVILRGITPLLSKFTLPLPLKPNYVVVEKTGWEVVGLEENGWADDQLQFSRIQQQSQQDKTKPIEPVALKPFVRVERTLQLGLDWRVITQITRISPADSAVVLTVPLLTGESVTSAGIRVKDNKVEVNMAAQQTTMQWESKLEKADKIDLIAPDTNQWIEVWKVDVSPVWHIESTGLSMIHLNSEGQWLPEWHPWANETVSLAVTRPESVLGKTLTIDSSRLQITQGSERLAVLNASLRSSQGMPHTLALPEGSLLLSVAINGRTQPLRLDGRKLTLPINPGKQDVSISWQEPHTAISPIMHMSEVDLGQDSVNSNLTANLGKDRWVLFAFGPQFGPIILFWGLLIVLIIVALGLGKITLTPLKNWQWFLLLVGLSQVPMAAAGIVVGWLIVLGWRANQSSEQIRYFNLLQISIGLLTLVSLGVLFSAVAQGLLGSPDMQVTGNHSSATVLNWYQDRSASTLPSATVISLPLIVYQLLMLAWALWLASALINWLKWGWGCFSSNGLWRKKIVLEKKTEVVEQEESKV